LPPSAPFEVATKNPNWCLINTTFLEKHAVITSQSFCLFSLALQPIPQFIVWLLLRPPMVSFCAIHVHSITNSRGNLQGCTI